MDLAPLCAHVNLVFIVTIITLYCMKWESEEIENRNTLGVPMLLHVFSLRNEPSLDAECHEIKIQPATVYLYARGKNRGLFIGKTNEKGHSS